MSESTVPAYYVSGPFDRELQAHWEVLVSQLFAVGSTDLGETYPQAAREALGAAAELVGLRLLGSRSLVHEVMCALGDGPAEGDLFAALDVLAEVGVVELGPAAEAQLAACGFGPSAVPLSPWSVPA